MTAVHIIILARFRGYAAKPSKENGKFSAAIRGFTSPAESFRPAGTIHERSDRGAIKDYLH